MTAAADNSAEKLPANAEKILAGLLSKPTIKDAAKAAGVSEATVFRALRNDAFSKLYRAGRREVTQHTVMRLQADSTQAAKVLREIIDDKQAPASVRVSAARIVIEQAFKGAEQTEVIERLRDLEKHIEATNPKGGRR